MRRKIKKSHPIRKLLLIIAVFGLIALFYLYNQYNYQISTPVNPTNTEEIIITVKKGDNIKKIANKLFEEKLILGEDSFKLYARLNNIDTQIKTGRFPLSQNMTVPEIFATLSSDEQREAVITIPEGYTVSEIDKLLAENSLIIEGEYKKAVQEFNKWDKYLFLDKEQQSKLIYPLEGYLFPDTYFVSANSFHPENLIDLQLITFRQKAIPAMGNSSLPIDQIVNIAAMVEEEAREKKDRPIIAGIIWKRFEENWQLGIDATSLYLKKDREITSDDLQEDSAYNTRKNTGLPPGPITNPGLDSIKASAFPEKSDYYYYLTAKDGHMVYAKTNTEHVNNKANYL